METFVVRVWAPADPLELPVTTERLQGRVEHATSDSGATFRGIDELGRLILVELRRVSGSDTDAYPTATVGSSVTRLMTMNSVADPSAVEALKFTGKRS